MQRASADFPPHVRTQVRAMESEARRAGLRVSVHDPSDGCVPGRYDQFTLRLPYGGRTLPWRVLFDAARPASPPDLRPLRVDDAVAGGARAGPIRGRGVRAAPAAAGSPSEAGCTAGLPLPPCDVPPLEALEPLVAWDASDRGCLWRLVLSLLAVHRRRQMQRLDAVSARSPWLRDALGAWPGERRDRVDVAVACGPPPGAGPTAGARGGRASSAPRATVGSRTDAKSRGNPRRSGGRGARAGGNPPGARDDPHVLFVAPLDGSPPGTALEIVLRLLGPRGGPWTRGERVSARLIVPAGVLSVPVPRLPRNSKFASVPALVEATAAALRRRRAHRAAIVAALDARLGAPLERDALDFSVARYLVAWTDPAPARGPESKTGDASLGKPRRAKRARRKVFCCVATVSLAECSPDGDGPGPVVDVEAVAPGRPQSLRLTSDAYPWSPRWSPQEVAKRLETLLRDGEALASFRTGFRAAAPLAFAAPLGSDLSGSRREDAASDIVVGSVVVDAFATPANGEDGRFGRSGAERAVVGTFVEQT